MEPGVFRFSEGARGLVRVKTLSRIEALGQLRQVLDCGGPPPLSDAK